MGKSYDLIILGTGPAGLSAGIYAARYGLKVLVLGKDIGGMINYTNLIENYPGFTGSGADLIGKLVQQAKKFGSEIIQSEVVNIKKDKEIFEVQTAKKEALRTKAIILALGTEKRKLNVKGENRLLGRGISYCAICDAPFFKDKVVSVIGGRNSAAQAALLLAKYAKKVYIIYRQEKLNCDAFLIKKVKQNKKIEVVYGSLPVKIKGTDVVEGLVIEQQGGQQNLPVEGIFIEIGSVPIISLAKKLGLKLDKEGYIGVDLNMGTNIKGIFAAGDITQSGLKQVVTAAAQGAQAASSVYKFLRERK